MTEEMRKNLSLKAIERYQNSPSPLLGRHISEEQKKNLSIIAKKRFVNKNNHPWFGRKHSNESKMKISMKLRGELHPKWKGGRFKNSNGYIWIWKPEHPFAMKCSPKGYVLEHRLIMEEKLGRYLKKGEVAHHINGIRNDNRIENLKLTTKGKHIAKHNAERIWKEASILKQKRWAEERERDELGRFAGWK
jgi:hypothetical protein